MSRIAGVGPIKHLQTFQKLEAVNLSRGLDAGLCVLAFTFIKCLYNIVQILHKDMIGYWSWSIAVWFFKFMNKSSFRCISTTVVGARMN